MTLTALNCNGNPLHPDPEVRDKHAQDVRDAIELARAAGRAARGDHVRPARHRRTARGCRPGRSCRGTAPTSTPATTSGTRSRCRTGGTSRPGPPRADVKVCIEMHPHNLVYNPATMERLATEIRATHVGAEMDPSHLFWQGIDPVARRPLARRPRLQRRGQGHPDQRGGQGQRGARRPVRAGRGPTSPVPSPSAVATR